MPRWRMGSRWTWIPSRNSWVAAFGSSWVNTWTLSPKDVKPRAKPHVHRSVPPSAGWKRWFTRRIFTGSIHHPLREGPVVRTVPLLMTVAGDSDETWGCPGEVPSEVVRRTSMRGPPRSWSGFWTGIQWNAPVNPEAKLSRGMATATAYPGGDVPPRRGGSRHERIRWISPLKPWMAPGQRKGTSPQNPVALRMRWRPGVPPASGGSRR